MYAHLAGEVLPEVFSLSRRLIVLVRHHKKRHVKFKDACDCSGMWQLSCSREDCFHTGWHLSCSGVASHRLYERRNLLEGSKKPFFEKSRGSSAKNQLCIHLPTNIQTDVVSGNVMLWRQDIYQPGLVSISSDINVRYSPLHPSQAQKIPFGIRWGDTRVLTITTRPYRYRWPQQMK